MMNSKSQQRSYYKDIRNKISPSVKALSDDGLFEVFCKFTKNYNSDCYLMFVSGGSEPETRKMIKFLWETGKKVAVPVCADTGNQMKFRFISSFEDLEKGKFGIYEPRADCMEVTAEDISGAVCIVPGICFDRSGYRVGYGKGYYDRFLCENKPLVSAGLCFSQLVINKVINDTLDMPVECIITEKGIIECFVQPNT